VAESNTDRDVDRPTAQQRVYARGRKPFREMNEAEVREFAEQLRQKLLAPYCDTPKSN
jgi:hypothetical protein